MRPPYPFVLSLAVSLPLAGSSPAVAQEEGATPSPLACQEAVHHAFDFWIGEWEVRLADGTLAGHNTIRRMAGGCGLAEHWRGSSGSVGESFNWADPVDGRWHQLWIDRSGLVLRLAGDPFENGMRLEGTGNDTTVLHRVTWTALEDGRVRQHWQVSRDDGGSWSTLFEGFYSRLPSEATEDVGADACDTPHGKRFDFWPGEWRVESRQRPPGGEWHETEGVWRAEAMVGGCGYLDFTVGDYGNGMMSGMGSRLYDPETDRWTITWTSTLAPGKTGIWEGGFAEDGTGEFFRETDTPDGTIHSRLRWMNIQEDSAEWDYSISRDGTEWTILWEMELRRLGRS